MIKAVFFDVDGTLLSLDTGTVPESTKRSLNRLKERGVKIFMSTGRHRTEIEQLPLDGLTFDGYITLNGQLCLDGDFSYLFGNPLNEQAVSELLTVFREKEVSIYLTQEKGLCINFVSDLARRVLTDIATEIPESAEPEKAPIFQATTFYRDEEDCWFHHHCPSGCRITRWCDGAVDIISEGGGKVFGIQKYLEYLDIRKGEIMAFGDAQNDVEMLQYAAIGVAMGNAKPEVQAIADYVTASVDDDGIEKALKHFELI